MTGGGATPGLLHRLSGHALHAAVLAPVLLWTVCCHPLTTGPCGPSRCLTTRLFGDFVGSWANLGCRPLRVRCLLRSHTPCISKPLALLGPTSAILRKGLRRDFAHHRLSGGFGSVRLYSRDDVWGALEAQRQIIENATASWRPLTPQGHGGQSHLVEADVHLPVSPQDWDAPVLPPFVDRSISISCSNPWRILGDTDADSKVSNPQTDHTTDAPTALGNALELGSGPWNAASKACFRSDVLRRKRPRTADPPTPVAEEQDELPVTVPSNQEATSSDEEPPAPVLLPIADGSFGILPNRLSGVSHIVQAVDSPTDKTLRWGRGETLQHLRPLYGPQLELDTACYAASAAIPAGFALCRRLGCHTFGALPQDRGTPPNTLARLEACAPPL